MRSKSRKILTSLLSLLISFEVSAEDYWFNAEYLYWKIEDAKKVIPLVVESPAVPDFTPVLDIPGAHVLLGDKKIDSKWRSGGRFSFGFFCGDMCPAGVEASYFFLGQSTTKENVFSNGQADSPFLSIPFIDSNTGLESSIALARPGSFNGSALLKVSNSMQGAELNSVAHLPYLSGWAMNIFGGFRYLNFSEKLNLHTDSLYINPALNDIFFTNDRFKVDNNYYGGQLGATALFECQGFMFNVKGKIGAGAMIQSSKVRGRFVTNNFTNFSLVQSFNGGYFALRSNSGTKRRTRFCVIPEMEVNCGYALTEYFSLSAGYSFLYVSNALRALKQLDRKINPTESPLYETNPAPIQIGASQPKNRMKSSDLWVQGLNLSMEYLF